MTTTRSTMTTRVTQLCDLIEARGFCKVIKDISNNDDDDDNDDNENNDEKKNNNNEVESISALALPRPGVFTKMSCKPNILPMMLLMMMRRRRRRMTKWRTTTTTTTSMITKTRLSQL